MTLPATGLRLSRIAFGTASLHHLLSRRARVRLLRTAHDAGITHFDTSPYYGDGVGEVTLAALPRETTIATKVGLYPRGGAHGSAFVAATRRALARALSGLARPEIDFDVRRAARSLEGSLRRLRRERVDLLFLHEPRAELIATEEWRRWFERERDRVGAFGVAGEARNLLPVLGAFGDTVRIIQARDSLALHEAEPLYRAGHPPHITYGHLVSQNAPEPAELLLRRAVERAPETVLLVSTRRVARVEPLARTGWDA